MTTEAIDRQPARPLALIEKIISMTTLDATCALKNKIICGDNLATMRDWPDSYVAPTLAEMIDAL